MTYKPALKKQRGLHKQRYTSLGDPERYTHHNVLALKDIFPLKSGVSPLKPPEKNASQAEKDQYRGLEAYQRKRFGEYGMSLYNWVVLYSLWLTRQSTLFSWVYYR